MEQFAGKVAVVTGAASGIGYGIAKRAGALGMKVVLADVEEKALVQAVETLRKEGMNAIGVLTDVSDPESVRTLADRTEEVFGPPWLVVNNAGVTIRGRRTWELRRADWEWLIGVNLWGVVHGIETFLPGMVARNDGYMVNTASMSGLVLSSRISAAYAATKHAVVGLSEVIYRELKEAGSGVGISVLCPGPVLTNISTAARNRPGSRPDAAVPAGTRHFPHQLQPDQVADQVFEAVSRRSFWILTHASLFSDSLKHRVGQICAGQNPDQSSADPVIESLDSLS